MIRVRRTAVPRVLVRHGTQWLSELRAVAADPSATRAQVERARNKYRYRSIKDALVAMFHDKCAYCESKVTHITYGAIEHFRPKAQYVNHTFEWNNLLLSCDICNDAGHKGDTFRLDKRGNPVLIDPTTSDPGLHLRFDWDPIAMKANIYGTDDRGREVVRVFDLNGVRGRKALLDDRSQYVETLLIFKKHGDQGDTQASALIHQACLPSSKYNAFALSLVCPSAPLP